MDPITTALIAVAAFGYMVYRQFVQRPVTAKDIIIPVAVGLYLADWYLVGGSATAVALALGAAGIGIVTGLLSGAVVRVWQDAATGAVYQRGAWSYLAVLGGLVAVRVVLHIVFTATGLLDATALNTAFIAMAVGTYAGRSITVGLRALALVGWDFDALPKQANRRSGRVRTW
jgi:membrane protein CcdC involved in cytochrome C biogenesis